MERTKKFKLVFSLTKGFSPFIIPQPVVPGHNFLFYEKEYRFWMILKIFETTNLIEVLH